MKKIDYSKRGPLIKVQIGPGRFVKMYERDAIARGLVKKERPQVENKMMVPDEEKSPITPPRPSPLARGGRSGTASCEWPVGPGAAIAIEAARHGLPPLARGEGAGGALKRAPPISL